MSRTRKHTRVRIVLAGFFAAVAAACSAAPNEQPTPTPLPETDAGTDATPAADATPTPIVPVCDPLAPRAVPLVLHVLPDEGEAALASEVTKATKSVRVLIYEMGYGAVLDALKGRAAAKVKVSVILDVGKKSINQKYFDQLTAAGAEVHWSDPKFPYMHAKTLIVDDALAVISTGNYLQSNVLKERNYVVHDRDPQDVADVAALFDADFGGTAPALDCTRLVVSPINARARILAVIASAKTTLDIESMQFADSDVRTAVADRAKAGVKIRVIVANPSWIDTNFDAATFLGQNAVPVKYLTAPTVHVKAIVADGERAYVGSENLSWTSLSKNREVGVIFAQQDAITTMNATFEKDWAAGTAF